MNNDNFEAIKAEILRRAKEADACTEQYARAYGSTSLPELCTVIRDNFNWCCRTQVINEAILMQYREDFAANDIRINEDATSGCVLCTGTATVTACDRATVRAYGSATVRAYDRATVRAYGSATVRVYGNATVEAHHRATVEAYGSATVEAYDSATVEAYDSATVTACGSATVRAYNSATVEAYGSATVRAYGNATVEAHDRATVRAYGNATVEAHHRATVEAHDRATVEAYGSAYCVSFAPIKCELRDNAIYRVESTDTIYYASDDIKFVKQ